MAKSLTESTVEGFYFTFGRAISRGLIQVVVLAILARTLSIADFGIFSAALVVVALAQVFSEMGMGPTIIQRADLDARHISTALTASLTAGVLIGAAIYLCAPLIERFFRIDGLAPVVASLAVLFPIMGAGIVPRSLLQKKLAFRQLAAIELGAYIFGYAPLAVGLAMFGLGVWSLVVAHIAEIVLRIALYIRASGKQFRFGFHAAAFRELIGDSAGYAVARLGNFVALQGDYLVVGRWLGSEALGVYGRAYQLLMMPGNLFGTAVDTVLFPAMSSVQSDRSRLQQAYLRSIGVVALISLPLTGLLVVLGPEVIGIVLGAKWDAVILPFQVLVTTLLFRTSYKISDSLTRATGAVYQRAWRQWIYAGAVFAGSLIGQAWGLTGVAVGVSLAIALNFLLMLDLSVKVLRIGYRRLFVLHARHLLVAAATTAAAFYTAVELRPDTSKFLVATAASGVAAIVGGIIVLAVPRLFGEEGRWAFGLLRKYTRKRR